MCGPNSTHDLPTYQSVSTLDRTDAISEASCELTMSADCGTEIFGSRSK